eukprot:scaffold51760_cov18-Tisochrysis_lutea.AAC.1
MFFERVVISGAGLGRQCSVVLQQTVNIVGGGWGITGTICVGCGHHGGTANKLGLKLFFYHLTATASNHRSKMYSVANH